MGEKLETPRHVEKHGFSLPTVLCTRCNRAMAVKREKEDVKTLFGTKSKFFLRYNCKDCETHWQEEEKPKGISGKLLVVICLVVLFLVIAFIMSNS